MSRLLSLWRDWRRPWRLDERAGCAAIVTPDATSPGLGRDYPGVVLYVAGRTRKDGRWHVPAWKIGILRAVLAVHAHLSPAGRAGGAS